MKPAVDAIANRLSLRQPQRDSLEILARVCEIVPLDKGSEPTRAGERRLMARLRRRAGMDPPWMHFRAYGYRAIRRFCGVHALLRTSLQRTTTFQIFADLCARLGRAKGMIPDVGESPRAIRRRRPRVLSSETLYELHSVSGPADGAIDFAIHPYFWLRQSDNAVYRAKKVGGDLQMEIIGKRTHAITLRFAGYWPAAPEARRIVRRILQRHIRCLAQVLPASSRARLSMQLRIIFEPSDEGGYTAIVPAAGPIETLDDIAFRSVFLAASGLAGG